MLITVQKRQARRLTKGNIMFKNNIGSTDRIIRIAIGVALIAAFFFVPTMPLRFVALIAGVIAIGTAVINSCLLYTILGLSTKKS